MYKEIKISQGSMIDYIGVNFDYIVPSEVSITMDDCERSILFECGVWLLRVTPAASTLFDTHDASKASHKRCGSSAPLWPSCYTLQKG